MFEQLKNIAMQKLQEKMAGNSLGATETADTAEWGANSVVETIKEKLGAGQMDQGDKAGLGPAPDSRYWLHCRPQHCPAGVGVPGNRNHRNRYGGARAALWPRASEITGRR